ncbi:MAG: 2-C-methyl-D-erythritol 4-phosphate cytidylyltransferase [Burkholderiaceae bacterium]|nr:2-C-methyl-D-erythritol 4-phosphate cytidylyltransferase [Burkholderiaceae bacterium]
MNGSPTQTLCAPGAFHPRLWALVPCAGNGARAQAAGPKQYASVAGQPMVLHTLAALQGVRRLAGTLVVVSAGDTFFDTQDAGVLVAACGGATRAQTVVNGLHALQEQGAQADDWVLVHDAARCLVTAAQIDGLIDACVDDPVGGLLALKLPDTLKQAHGDRVSQTVDRSDKWLAQTPQMFRLAALQQALQVAGDAVTDESSAMEFMGLQPRLVEGSAQNFKVTYPQDFALAQAVLAARGP